MKRLGALSAVALLLGAFVVPGPAAAGDNGELHRCKGVQGYFISQATLELPPGFWTEGEHHHSIHFLDPSVGIDDTWGPFEFTVSDSAPLYPGQVIVAVRLVTTGWTPVADQTINPAQDTALWAGWAFGPGDYPSMPAAYEDLDDAAILFTWDDGDEILARQGPYTSTCANLWLANFHRTYGPVALP